jgi:ComF family protein
MLATNIVDDFLGLLYPRICACCLETLVRNETVFCTSCRYELPRTNYHKEQENEVSQIFWGRVLLENATAYFSFHKGGRVQALMHKLKYKGQQEIGIELGNMIGRDLKQSAFSNADIVVPVPLHKSKQRKRGYNQSECIAEGIAKAMDKPLDTETLYRTIDNPTQTKKHRFERWTNVDCIFSLKKPESIANKHIILVDDVITTGATLEACASALQKAGNVKVSIVAVAKA